MNSYEGPAGEHRQPLKRALCVGADLTKQTQKRKNDTGIQPLECAYCARGYHSQESCDPIMLKVQKMTFSGVESNRPKTFKF